MGSKCNTSETGIGIAVLPVTQLDGIIAASVAGVTVTVAIVMPVAAIYKYVLWLSDSATDPTPSLFPPTDPPVVSWNGNTTAAGTATITFKNTGAARTWYMWGYFQRIDVTSAITVGV
jgi:hypothetical protein